MANDILNTSNSNTGNQVLGRIIINTGGRGANLKQTLSTSNNDSDTIAIGDIDDKYDTRFDDPRYYSGDAIT